VGLWISSNLHRFVLLEEWSAPSARHGISNLRDCKSLSSARPLCQNNGIEISSDVLEYDGVNVQKGKAFLSELTGARIGQDLSLAVSAVAECEASTSCIPATSSAYICITNMWPVASRPCTHKDNSKVALLNCFLTMFILLGDHSTLTTMALGLLSVFPPKPMMRACGQNTGRNQAFVNVHALPARQLIAWHS
jgi:hypothetical protein